MNNIQISKPRPSTRSTDFEPDWFVQKSTSWIVFPHELEEMTKEEILEHKGIEITQYYK